MTRKDRICGWISRSVWRGAIAALAAGVILAPAIMMSQASEEAKTTWTYAVIYSFPGGDNAGPIGSLLLAAGNIYGTALPNADPYGYGLVFKLNRAGSERILHGVSGGPYSGVIRDTAGNLYGTTVSGGSFGWGNVFKLDPTGNWTVLYSFTGGADGGWVPAGLTRDAAGNLYGTTQLGGANGGYSSGSGVVFKLDGAGNETVLHTFQGPDGAQPTAVPIRDGAGNLYGATYSGGAYGYGVVYKLAASGNETVLYSFAGGADGAEPTGILIHDSAGNHS